MKLFPDLELVVPLEPGQWTDLYFAVTSGSYDEYALKCATAGVTPLFDHDGFKRQLSPDLNGGGSSPSCTV